MDVRFILFISFPKDFPENIFPLAFDSFRNKFLKRSSLICLGQFAPQVRKFHVEPFGSAQGPPNPPWPSH